MLVAVAASAIGVSPAQAAITVRETPDRTWNTNGPVVTTELSDDGKTLYIGGNFTAVGAQPRQNLAAVDATNGTVDPWARGMREFVVGTGGASHYGFGAIKPNSQLRNAGT